MRVYQNESETVDIGKLTIENRTDRVTIYGSLDVTRDKAGLAAVKELKATIDAIVAFLEGEKLPEHITMKTPGEIKNPFKR
ncbi:MAG: hypothetical protein GC190_20370 [Alphaproteobacteria bacterium]|nr:hypothetical protein [Alphaproteobacteria bacterium]